MENKKRSIAKTITWRLIGLTNGFLVTLLFLGDVVISVGISVVANAIAVILYYCHERIWNKIQWGKQKNTSKK